MSWVFSIEDPFEPTVKAILDGHLVFAREETPPEGVFAMDAHGLSDPSVTLFAARSAATGDLVGVGALKMLGDGHAELKSMHVVASARRLGVGRALVEHLVSVAGQRGCGRVSLETGTTEAFAGARTLYAGCGFTVCEPFGPYVGSPTSFCMTLTLP